MDDYLLLFFSIGGAEIFIVLLVVIMFFGSKKIPELARNLGKGIREIKNVTNDIQQEIKNNTGDLNKLRDAVDVEKQINEAMEENPETLPDKDNKTEKTSSTTNTIARS